MNVRSLRLAAVACPLLLLAGCSDARRPAVREMPAQSPHSSLHGLEPSPGGMHGSSDMVHGMPHGEVASPETDLGPEVKLGDASLTAPEGWTRKPPRSGFVLAEFSLPPAEADQAEGRLTVTAVGGSVEENVERWRQQFGGKPDHQSQEQVDVAGTKVDLVDLSGTYVDQHMGFAPAEPLSGYRMLAAIFSVEGQQYIVKCSGPAKTIASHAEEFRAFIRSLRSARSSAAAAKAAGTESPEASLAETAPEAASQP